MSELHDSLYPIPQPARIDRDNSCDASASHFAPDFTGLAHLAFGSPEAQNAEASNPLFSDFFSPDELYVIRLMANREALDDIFSKYWPELDSDNEDPYAEEPGHSAVFELDSCEVRIGNGCITARHKSIPTQLSASLHSFDSLGNPCMRRYPVQDQDSQWPEKDRKELADWTAKLVMRIVADFCACPNADTMPRFAAYDEKLAAEAEALDLRKSIGRTEAPPKAPQKIL